MLNLKQPRSGFRYSIDSYLLARFAKFRKGDFVCDLGAGTGILGFLALRRGSVKQVTAVEIQSEMARLAQDNATGLGFDDQFKVECVSWQSFAKRKNRPRFDVVMSNPPYRKKNTGKLSTNLSLAIAKHELKGNMVSLLQSMTALLKLRGLAYLIYPTLRLEELLQVLPTYKLKVQRLAFVHSYESRPATHFMVELVRSTVREIKVEEPVIIYQDAKNYRPEIEVWIGPKKRLKPGD